jgi:hypothetical protein
MSAEPSIRQKTRFSTQRNEDLCPFTILHWRASGLCHLQEITPFTLQQQLNSIFTSSIKIPPVSTVKKLLSCSSKLFNFSINADAPSLLIALQSDFLSSGASNFDSSVYFQQRGDQIEFCVDLIR